MTETPTLTFEKRDLHVEQFTFSYNEHRNEFISGASDCLIKFLSLDGETARESIDENHEITSLLCSDNKIFYSQNENLKMAKLNESGLFNPKDALTLTSFATNIIQIRYNTKYHVVAAFSEDDDLHIINIDDMNVYKYKTNEVSLKFMENSKNENWLITAGCDGTLTVYQYSNEEGKKGLIVLKEKVSNVFAKTTLENKTQSDCFDINDNGVCVLSGDILLKYFSIEQSSIDIIKETTISHSANINVVKWIDSKFVLTCDVNNKISIWDFDHKINVYDFTKIDIENPIRDITLVYPEKESFKIVFADEEGSLHISNALKLKLDDHDKQFDMDIDKLLDEVDDEKKEEKNSEKILDLSVLEDENGNIRPKDEIEQKLQEKKENEYELNINSIKEQLHICELQEPFIPSSTFGDGQLPRYLCCNLTGRIISRSEASFKQIDIYFSDTTNKKNISFIDTNDFSIATMNNVGALFANKIEELNIDEYEKENRRSEATIDFKSIQVSTTSLLTDWSVKLPEEENPMLLAIGSDWCCAYTSMGFLRIYSIFGGEKYKFSVDTSIVAMCGYENYLAFAYHVSLPFSNSQHLRFKILDSNKMFNEVYDGDLSITPESHLIWFGFSEEGVLISYDSYNILRGLFIDITSRWVPLLDLGEKYSGTNINYWVVGVEEGEVFGIEMKGDMIEPLAVPKPIQKTFKFVKGNEEEWVEDDFKVDFYMIMFYEKRFMKYYQIKNIRSVNFPEYCFTDFLKDESDIKKMKKEHDKKMLTEMNNFIIKGENSKVITHFDFLFQKKSKEILISICKEYNQHELSNYLIYKFKLCDIVAKESKQQVIIQEASASQYKSIIKETNQEDKIESLADIAVNLKNYQASADIIPKEEPKKEVIVEEKDDEEIIDTGKNNSLNMFSKSNNESAGGHDLFNELSKLNNGKSTSNNNLQKSGSKVGFKRKHKELLNAALPFERDSGKKMKK